MKRVRKGMAGLLGALATLLGFFEGRRSGVTQRWRLALWALAVALIAGTAGGVSIAEAETVAEYDANATLDAGDLNEAEPSTVVSCYCTVSPPHRW